MENMTIEGLESQLKKAYCGHIYLEEDGSINHKKVRTNPILMFYHAPKDCLISGFKALMLPRRMSLHQGMLMWDTSLGEFRIYTIKTKKNAGLVGLNKLLKEVEEVAKLKGFDYIYGGDSGKIPGDVGRRFGWELVNDPYRGELYRKYLMRADL